MSRNVRFLRPSVFLCLFMASACQAQEQSKILGTWRQSHSMIDGKPLKPPPGASHSKGGYETKYIVRISQKAEEVRIDTSLIITGPTGVTGLPNIQSFEIYDTSRRVLRIRKDGKNVEVTARLELSRLTIEFYDAGSDKPNEREVWEVNKPGGELTHRLVGLSTPGCSKSSVIALDVSQEGKADPKAVDHHPLAHEECEPSGEATIIFVRE